MKHFFLTTISKIKLFFYDKNIYCFSDLIPYKYRMLYWEKIKPIFFPCHSRLRKAIPRGWSDLTQLIATVNFEFIKSFYEEEYKTCSVDWKATPKHARFEKWLKKAYRYITVERPILEQRMLNAYPPSKPFEEMFKPIVDKNGNKMYELVTDGVPYEIKYKDVIFLENKIEKTDTEILTNLIKYRQCFWT